MEENGKENQRKESLLQQWISFYQFSTIAKSIFQTSIVGKIFLNLA